MTGSAGDNQLSFSSLDDAGKQKTAKRVVLGRKPAAGVKHDRALQRLGPLFFAVGRMLMHAHDGAVDHIDIAFVSSRNGLQDMITDTGGTPAHEAIAARRVRTIALGNAGPRRAAAKLPEDAVLDVAAVNARNAARFVRQNQCDDLPLGAGKFVA